jgi:ADP-ribosylglycohydrolase
MAAQARENGETFPPRDYWSHVAEPWELHYATSPRRAYFRGNLHGAPVDDDLMYTVLGLLILEDAGPGFDTTDVARLWLRHLPHACTAEEVALRNLRQGMAPERAAEVDNPYQHWIGADIRADPWGYVAPGWPEHAAELAWRDATLSHRRAGVHGAMFFAAAIAAAFATGDPIAALRVGLTEIPRDAELARALRWALRTAPRLADFRAARAAVDRRFPHLDPVHTINNACLTVFGLWLGGRDFSRVIGGTVAMGLDNDCTAATAGSLFGAAYGLRSIPAHWRRPLANRLDSYLIGQPGFALDDLCRRFMAQADAMHDLGA